MSAAVRLLEISLSYIEERKHSDDVINLRRLVRVQMCEIKPEYTADICEQAVNELQKDVGILDLGDLSYSSVVILLNHTIARLGR